MEILCDTENLMRSAPLIAGSVRLPVGELRGVLTQRCGRKALGSARRVQHKVRALAREELLPSREHGRGGRKRDDRVNVEAHVG